MTKFAFTRREVVETSIWFEDETEHGAWAQAVDGEQPVAIGDAAIVRKPIFSRTPKLDEHDL